MNITKQKKKRASSETVTEPDQKTGEHSPAKKQKKNAKKLEKPGNKPANGNVAETKKVVETAEPQQLSAGQRKRQKMKERKLAAIAKVIEEGGKPVGLWQTKKEKGSKGTKKGVESTDKGAKKGVESTDKGAKKGVESTNKSAGKTDESKKARSAEEKLKAKQAKSKKLRQEKRLQDGQYKAEQVTLSPDEVRLRIADIKGRGELTKTARRKLAVLLKKLAVLEGTAPTTVVPKTSTEKSLSSSEKRRLRREKKQSTGGGEAEADGGEEADPAVEKPVDIHTFEKKKNKVVKKEVKGKVVAKQQGKVDQKPNGVGNKPTGKKGKKAEPVSIAAEDEEEEEEEEEEAEAESDEESEADEDSEGEEEEMEASSEEDESEENELNTSTQEGEEEEEEDEDEDDEEDDASENVKIAAPIKAKKEEAGGKKQKEKGQNLKDKSNEEQNADKKKRYVLFVGNVPFDAKSEDIKKHFLTKVGNVSSVRIPTKQGTQIPRGFAYVEVTNDVDYEKGLSLHHTFLNGRRINVEYTLAGSKQVVKRQELVSKNQKLHAMRKAGQLAGSQKHDQKRSVRRFKKREQEGKQN